MAKTPARSRRRSRPDPADDKPNTRRAASSSKLRSSAPVRTHSTTPGPTQHRWTFLTNHAHVLILLNEQPDLVLREVAARVGITERAVQRIIHDLESEGYIRREKVGRQNRYEVLSDEPLRHPIESHRDIGDLLRLISQG